MGEVAESEGVAAEGFQPSVDGFGGAVGGVVVEVGQDVVTAPVQGPAEGRELPDAGHGTRVDDGAPAVLAYEGPLAFWDWVVELNYLASSDGVVVLQQQRGATPVRVPVRRGAHTVYARVTGTGDGLVARAETPGLVACVGSGPVGLLVPASAASGSLAAPSDET